MKCRNKKCEKEFDQAFLFCPYCGTSVVVPERKRTPKSRGNGQGTAYRRGKTWTARATRYITITMPDGTKKVERVEKTKGGFPTKTAALNYCADIWSKPHRVQCNMTFYELFQRWKPYYENRIGSNTMATYVAAFKYFEPIQYYMVDEIKSDDLQKCINDCDKSRSTINNMKTVASLLFKFAMSQGIVDRNQAEFTSTTHKQKGERLPVPEEALKLIEKEVGHFPYADYVYFLCYTGVRENELLSFTKNAYREKKQGDETIVYLVGGSKTKAGKERELTISPKVLPILQARMATDNELLFPRLSDGKKMTGKYFLNKCFKPFIQHLGLSEDIVVHSCRHTFANLLKNVEGSDTDKAALMGHAHADMTKEYQSSDIAAKKKITDKI